MCVFGKSGASPAPPPAIIPAGTNLASQRQGDFEARLRRLRAGAAANILTSARGIPATSTLGGIANGT